MSVAQEFSEFLAGAAPSDEALEMFARENTVSARDFAALQNIVDGEPVTWAEYLIETGRIYQ